LGYKDSATLSLKGIISPLLTGNAGPFYGGDAIAGTWAPQSGSIYKIAYTGPVNDLFVDNQCMLQARHPNMPYDSARGGFVMLMPQDNAANPPAGVDWTGVIRIHDGGTTWVNKIEQSNSYSNDPGTILIGPVGLLDAEGEWAFRNNTLYLRAPRGGNPGSCLVEAKSRDYGFNQQSIRGRFFRQANNTQSLSDGDFLLSQAG
jgi:hypothetical protein